MRQGADRRADLLVHAARAGRRTCASSPRRWRAADSRVVSLRDASCTDELRCRVGPVPPLFARSLAPGPHVFTVAGTRQIDASILVKTYPADAAPNDQSCATADPSSPNTTFAGHLSKHEDAIKNGCLPGGPSAAYKLDLAVDERRARHRALPAERAGSVSLSGPGAGPPTSSCRRLRDGGDAAARVGAEGPGGKLPRGGRRRARADGAAHRARAAQRAADGRRALRQLRDAVHASRTTGGFFIGDTTNSSADFSAGCDAPGQPIGGAKDQIMKLALTQKQRVVLDMIGSSYTTILDVRQGATCPATEVPNACYVGFNAGRSFLDLTLDPGTTGSRSTATTATAALEPRHARPAPVVAVAVRIFTRKTEPGILLGALRPASAPPRAGDPDKQFRGSVFRAKIALRRRGR